MRRTAEAIWRGSGAEGEGRMTTGSGALREQPFSLRTRFVSEDGRAGSNPEELIAAAHAGCFSMALSFHLAGAGHPPEELHTLAVLTMESEGVHWTITALHLVLRARVPGIGPERFRQLADAALETCPVSKVLNARITLETHLE